MVDSRVWLSSRTMIRLFARQPYYFQAVEVNSSTVGPDRKLESLSIILRPPWQLNRASRPWDGGKRVDFGVRPRSPRAFDGWQKPRISGFSFGI